MINIMSGSNVTLNYGEGILDFVYADFLTPAKKLYTVFSLLERIGEEEGYHSKSEDETEKNPDQLTDEEWTLRTYNDFDTTFPLINNIAYASLYSAIFHRSLKAVPKRAKA